MITFETMNTVTLFNFSYSKMASNYFIIFFMMTNP